MSENTAWLTLSSRTLTARIDPLGAQLSILRDALGRDLLWDGDPAFWTGRAAHHRHRCGCADQRSSAQRSATRVDSASRRSLARWVVTIPVKIMRGVAPSW